MASKAVSCDVSTPRRAATDKDSAVRVPGKDIPLFTVYMAPEVDRPLLDVLHSGYIGQGSKVEEFERALATRFSNRNVLTLNSATSALHLALRLAGVKTGDEVISTAMTCTATNMPILANGAKIVWADVDAETGLIDPLDVERKITKRTKAIMCVDWGGTPCDLDELMRVAAKYGLKVIEDAAHAIGATYKGRPVGSGIVDYTCFSFQAIKHITTVDGGALFCRDTQDYKRGKLLRWYGIDRESERKDFRCEENIEEWGYKFHMNDINATIGLAQLPHLEDILGRYRENAAYYNTNLNHSYFITPLWTSKYHNESAYWLYTLLLPNKQERIDFMRFMKSRQVMVSQVHARNDGHETFKESVCNLPGVDRFYDRMVCIPVHSAVSDADRRWIATCANEFSARPR